MKFTTASFFLLLSALPSTILANESPYVTTQLDEKASVVKATFAVERLQKIVTANDASSWVRDFSDLAGSLPSVTHRITTPLSGSTCQVAAADLPDLVKAFGNFKNELYGGLNNVLGGANTFVNLKAASQVLTVLQHTQDNTLSFLASAESCVPRNQLDVTKSFSDQIDDISFKFATTIMVYTTLSNLE